MRIISFIVASLLLSGAVFAAPKKEIKNANCASMEATAAFLKDQEFIGLFQGDRAIPGSDVKVAIFLRPKDKKLVVIAVRPDNIACIEEALTIEKFNTKLMEVLMGLDS